jgi:hypothetical protein
MCGLHKIYFANFGTLMPKEKKSSKNLLPIYGLRRFKIIRGQKTHDSDSDFKVYSIIMFSVYILLHKWSYNTTLACLF